MKYILAILFLFVITLAQSQTAEPQVKPGNGKSYCRTALGIQAGIMVPAYKLDDVKPTSKMSFYITSNVEITPWVDVAMQLGGGSYNWTGQISRSFYIESNSPHNPAHYLNFDSVHVKLKETKLEVPVYADFHNPNHLQGHVLLGGFVCNQFDRNEINDYPYYGGLYTPSYGGGYYKDAMGGGIYGLLYGAGIGYKGGPVNLLLMARFNHVIQGKQRYDWKQNYCSVTFGLSFKLGHKNLGSLNP